MKDRGLVGAQDLGPVVDVGGVAVVKLVGQPVFRAQNGLREPGEQLLRRICVVPEALAKLTIET